MNQTTQEAILEELELQTILFNHIDTHLIDLINIIREDKHNGN